MKFNIRLYVHRCATAAASFVAMCFTMNGMGTAQCTAGVIFGPAALVSELNGPTSDAMTDISSDGLSVVIHSQRNPSNLNQFDLYTATRPDLASPFSSPVQGPFNVVNGSAFNISDGVLSSDGLELFYHFATSPVGQPMFRTTRSSTAVSFPTGTQVSTLNLGFSIFSRPSFLSPDDLRLYVDGDGDLHLAERATISDTFVFSAFNPFVNINGSTGVGSPYLTSDELTVYYSSGGDIWTATRSSITDPFSSPMLVQGGVNTSAVESGAVIFGDTLYFTRNNDIYSATMQSAAVPEPSSFALLGIGGLTLFGYGWRRKRASVA